MFSECKTHLADLVAVFCCSNKQFVFSCPLLLHTLEYCGDLHTNTHAHTHMVAVSVSVFLSIDDWCAHVLMRPPERISMCRVHYMYILLGYLKFSDAAAQHQKQIINNIHCVMFCFLFLYHRYSMFLYAVIIYYSPKTKQNIN